MLNYEFDLAMIQTCKHMYIATFFLWLSWLSFVFNTSNRKVILELLPQKKNSNNALYNAMLTFIHKHWTNDIEQPVPSQNGGQAPGVVDLVHVDMVWKHIVIRLDIKEGISSTVVTRLTTGRDSWTPDHWDSLATRDRNLISHHECLGEVSIARELGGSPHDVVHCVRDAGVAAILRD